jgi:hypothetical protein
MSGLQSWLIVIASVLLLIAAGCGGSAEVAAPASPIRTSSAAPPPPPPAPSGPLNITSPSSGSVITSPAPFSATSSLPDAVQLRLQMDGNSIFWTDQMLFSNEYMFLPTGGHTIALVAYDKDNKPVGQTSINVDVVAAPSPATTQTTIPQIQNLPNYEWCTATRSGHPCASGLGDATLSVTQNVSSPSSSGASAKFTIGGPKQYSNALWWKTLGGGELQSHFTYALDFMIDNPSAPEALEFDLNQSLGGVRYTWGTECSFKDTGRWDIWNDATEKWETTKVPCKQVSKGWHHLVWQFERVGTQIHYVSVTLDNTKYTVDLYRDPQPNWQLEELNVAFQMDGDYKQTPYTVWVDNMTMTVY